MSVRPSVATTSKKCSKCRAIKPGDAFSKKGDGLQSWCKECQALWRSSEAGRVSNRLSHARYERSAKGKERAAGAVASSHRARWKSANADRVVKYQRDTQGGTMATAARSGHEWTGPELEIALRADLTARQVALMVRRTYAAVVTIRKVHRMDIRKQVLAGVTK